MSLFLVCATPFHITLAVIECRQIVFRRSMEKKNAKEKNKTRTNRIERNEKKNCNELKGIIRREWKEKAEREKKKKTASHTLNTRNTIAMCYGWCCCRHRRFIQLVRNDNASVQRSEKKATQWRQRKKKENKKKMRAYDRSLFFPIHTHAPFVRLSFESARVFLYIWYILYMYIHFQRNRMWCDCDDAEKRWKKKWRKMKSEYVKQVKHQSQSLWQQRSTSSQSSRNKSHWQKGKKNTYRSALMCIDAHFFFLICAALIAYASCRHSSSFFFFFSVFFYLSFFVSFDFFPIWHWLDDCVCMRFFLLCARVFLISYCKTGRK